MGIQKPKIEYYSTNEIEFMTVDVLHVDLLKKGNVTIGGLVLLKKDIEGDYRLILKQGEVEREIEWGISSPWFASKYPDNPKAKNARFQISGIFLSNDTHLEIYLEKEKIIKLNF